MTPQPDPGADTPDPPAPESGAADLPVRDPGLQPERTRLAWRRTALTLTGIMVLTVRLALHHGRFGALLAAVAVAGWAAVLVAVWFRATAATAAHAGGGPALPLTALVTAGYALLGTMLVLAGPF